MADGQAQQVRRQMAGRLSGLQAACQPHFPSSRPLPAHSRSRDPGLEEASATLLCPLGYILDGMR